jgi:hypothetical protein
MVPKSLSVLVVTDDNVGRLDEEVIKILLEGLPTSFQG